MAARAERRVRTMDRGRWTDERYYIFAVKASWLGYVVCGLFLSQEDFDFFYHLLGITSRLLVFGLDRHAALATGADPPAGASHRALPSLAGSR
jgi:hypothetical protein